MRGMSHSFFEKPIINSPYTHPNRHWELDDNRQPTDRILETRRRSDLTTPVPKPKKQRRRPNQREMVLDAGEGLSTEEQEYNPTPIINEIRQHVEAWRGLPNPNDWQVTPETARLLQHWRHHPFQGIRPFFCQVEAVETAIWLTEVAPKLGKRSRPILGHIEGANEQANPGLLRLALKLATGAGKTTVMAMLIAWQTVNAVRRPNSGLFTRGFLVVTPGITIRDRLRVLLPNDPDSYYKGRELIPNDMLGDIGRAKIVITNYHAFKRRDRMDLARGTRALLKGRGPELDTLETEGQMLQRVMPDLMGMKTIVVLNDEAHHCYREKVRSDDEFVDADGKPLKGDALRDAKEEAKRNTDAARLWIGGIEAVQPPEADLRHAGCHSGLRLRRGDAGGGVACGARRPPRCRGARRRSRCGHRRGPAGRRRGGWARRWPAPIPGPGPAAPADRRSAAAAAERASAAADAARGSVSTD